MPLASPLENNPSLFNKNVSTVKIFKAITVSVSKNNAS